MQAQQDPKAKVSINLSLQPASTFEGPAHFTPDSLVWIATLTGDHVEGGGPMGNFTNVTEEISPEDGMELGAFSQAAPTPSGPASPNLQVGDGLVGSPVGAPSPNLKFSGGLTDGLVYVGDPLSLNVTGPASSTPITLTLKTDTATLLTKQMTYGDLATYRPKLDPADLPGLQDLPVQNLEVDLSTTNSSTGTTFYLVKDRTAQAPPQESASRGQYDGLDFDASLAKYALTIATSDWQGTNLKVTSREATAADWALDAPREQLESGVAVRLFEISGTYPNFVLPAIVSGTGKLTVMRPTVVRVVIAESSNMVVVSDRGFTQ